MCTGLRVIFFLFLVISVEGKCLFSLPAWAPTHTHTHTTGCPRRHAVALRVLGAARGPPSLTGVSALAALPHVLRVELHLDGHAVEPKLGVEPIGGFLQHRLGVGAVLWCGVRKQDNSVAGKALAPPPEGSVGLPMARWTETRAWPTVRAQRRRQWTDLTSGTASSTSFTELNSIPLGEPGKQSALSKGRERPRGRKPARRGQPEHRRRQIFISVGRVRVSSEVTG